MLPTLDWSLAGEALVLNSLAECHRVVRSASLARVQHLFEGCGRLVKCRCVSTVKVCKAGCQAVCQRDGLHCFRAGQSHHSPDALHIQPQSSPKCASWAHCVTPDVGYSNLLQHMPVDFALRHRPSLFRSSHSVLSPPRPVSSLPMSPLFRTLSHSIHVIKRRS